MYGQVKLDKTMLANEETGKVMLTHFLDGKIGASVKEGSSVIHLYRIDDKKAEKNAETGTKDLIRILGLIVSIPCLRFMIKVSMPILVWLEDIYYYSYHLYGF